jgi:hypothetical protein
MGEGTSILELIQEIEKKIKIKKLTLERRKERLEIFIDEADNYYTILSLIISIRSWEECLKLILKYYDTRENVDQINKSAEIEAIFELNTRKYNTVLISERDKGFIVEYIKLLEWKLESLHNLNNHLDNEQQ